MAVEVPVVDKVPVTSQDFLDAFNDDDKTPPKKEVDLKLDDADEEIPDEDLKLKTKNKEIVEPEENEDDEEVKDEEEEPELKLEDEDEVDLARIPRRTEIKEAFPEIFKKFPQLDHIIQREHQFSELFSTLKEAKDVKESIGDYNAFQAELFNGDIKGILRAVKKSDENAYNKLVGNWIEDLARVDPAANLRVANKITRSILKVLDNKAKELGMGDGEEGEQLSIAVRLVNKALYGSTKLSEPEINQETQEDPREARLKEEQNKFEQQKYQAAFGDISGQMKNWLNKVVAKNVDPKETIPAYLKEKLIEDVLSALDNQLMDDTRFKNLVGSLYASAHKSGYDQSSRDKILETLKNKAKSMLPPIIRAKKERALKGSNSFVRRKEVVDDEEDVTPTNVGAKREPREKITSNRQDGKDRLKIRDGESINDFFARE